LSSPTSDELDTPGIPNTSTIPLDLAPIVPPSRSKRKRDKEADHGTGTAEEKAARKLERRRKKAEKRRKREPAEESLSTSLLEPPARVVSMRGSKRAKHGVDAAFPSPTSDSSDLLQQQATDRSIKTRNSHEERKRDDSGVREVVEVDTSQQGDEEKAKRKKKKRRDAD